MRLQDVVLCFLCFFACGVFAICADVRCKNLPPNLSRMALGTNIISLDLFPSNPRELVLGNTLFEFSCNEEKKCVLDGKLFDMPDQIVSIVSMPHGKLQSSATITETLDKVKETLSTQLEVSAKVMFVGSYSASAGYKKSREKVLKSSKTFSTVEAILGYYMAEFDTTKLNFTQNFKHDLANLPPNYEDEAEMYEKFVTHHGTHFYRKSRFGGKIQLTTTMDSSFAERLQEQQIKGHAKTSFNFAVVQAPDSMEIDGETETEYQTFKEKTEIDLVCYGGKAEERTKLDVGAWFKTVLEDPWQVGGKLEFIHEFCDDKNVKAQLEKAVKFMGLRASLDDVKGSLRLGGIDLEAEKYQFMKQNLSQIEHYCAKKKYDSLEQKQSENQIKEMFRFLNKEWKRTNAKTGK